MTSWYEEQLADQQKRSKHTWYITVEQDQFGEKSYWLYHLETISQYRNIVGPFASMRSILRYTDWYERTI